MYIVCTQKTYTLLFFRSFFRNNQPNNHWSHAFLGDMALLWTCSQASFFKRPASKLKDLYQGRRCIQFLKALLHFLCDAWYKHPNFVSVRIKDSHYAANEVVMIMAISACYLRLSTWKDRSSSSETIDYRGPVQSTPFPFNWWLS